MSQPVAYDSPEVVEQAFYDAISRCDADLLMLTWAEDEEILCVHPTGVRLSGEIPIRESWLSIFQHTRLRIKAALIAHWQSSVVAVHHLHETLFIGDDPNPQGLLHVTHIYMRGSQGWRLVVRHASASDEEHQAMAESIPHTLH